MAPRDGALLGAEAGLRAAMQTPDEMDGADDRAEREEQALLAELMDDTEREIAAEAFDKEPEDNDGDTSIEDAAGEEEEPEDEEGDEPTPSPEEEIDDATGQPIAQFERGDLRVPLRQARDENRQLREQLARLEGRVDGLSQRPAQPPQPPQPRPDMFSDPEGWERAVRQEAADTARQALHEERVNAALAEAHERHGEEFAYAFRQFTAQTPSQETSALARRMVNSPDPGAFLMRWAEPILQDYRAERSAAEADRIAELLEANPELLDAITERLNGGTRQRGEPRAPRNPQPQPRSRRGPPSLNAAGGSNSARVGADPRGFDGSEQSIFDYAFTQ
jgi:hypothetical protein